MRVRYRLYYGLEKGVALESEIRLHKGVRERGVVVRVRYRLYKGARERRGLGE